MPGEADLANRKSKQWNRREFVGAATTALVSQTMLRAEPQKSATKRKVYLVPNFHPASCGWLTTFSRERVYCANSYLDHLDRVRDDPKYAFVMSEVNNIVAIMNFQPDRIPELKQRVKQGRMELVNGFFLESTVNLSGGEALVRQGVEGLRWYEQVFGLRPRYAWTIDVCGTHDQMAQIAAGLGLDAMVYTRRNPTGKTIHWSVSPDGSKILTLCPGHYSEAHSIFTTKEPLNASQLNELEAFFDKKEPITPEGAPILVLAGNGDYALAPARKEYPSEFLKQWKEAQPERPIEFTTLTQYVNQIAPRVKSGRIAIPSMLGGTGYAFDAFWIENPRVKTLYRRNEHALQAAEILATIASLKGSYEYPVTPLANSWILMCLNMDRNTLWGSAGGMVFESEKSWDAQDRFKWVQNTTSQALTSAGQAVLGSGDGLGLFNPLNWKRSDAMELRLPENTSLEGIACEALPGGVTLCSVEMPPASVGSWKLANKAPAAPRKIDLPETIETRYYSARFDRETGALTSLKTKPSGQELLAAPANVVVAERPAKQEKSPGDQMPPRSGRTRIATSSEKSSTIQVTEGPVAIIVEATGTFYGDGAIRRTVRFYHDHPRIDFETELNNIPTYTVVVAEFPLRQDVLEVRRAIPFGFSHGAWAKPNPNLHGWTKGIVPAVRWIHFDLEGGGGFAIFDRGLSGRELDGRTPIIYLLNAEDKYQGYENSWLSGKGKHVLPYALAAHEGTWDKARIPQMAWEYNREPVVIPTRATSGPQSFLETSDNVIVEAMRREGNHIELRLVECLGRGGEAEFSLNLPHRNASLTDLTGRKKSALRKSSRYRFPVRPQQIITMQFETAAALPNAEPVKAWDTFVPKDKLPALHAYDPNLKGHPPFGT
ncbi:MAG TPA: glycoside hydrolase family 38 C-terminal domain-containing protein [Bryobacteraceae bacterium]|nr:glycoside hydrolase family 38 C-terminal domain-containing protein [Bryobacteraceae bacterium]